MNGKQRTKLRRGADYNRSAERGERCARDFLFHRVSREVARFLEGGQRRRYRIPNSIARVNARFAGGTESSKVSANPRGQRTSGTSLPKRWTSPCVNATPAIRSARRPRE